MTPPNDPNDSEASRTPKARSAATRPRRRKDPEAPKAPEAPRGAADPERTAARALRFFTGGAGAEGAAAEGASEARRGLPGEADVRAIAARLRPALAAAPGFEAFGAAPLPLDAEAEGLARSLVAQAAGAIQALREGAPPHSLSPRDSIALEAVIDSRDRPAIRVLGDRFEDLAALPSAAQWRIAADTHRRDILAAVHATAAVRVTDNLLGGRTWVQGSAWLIAPDLAITNRHVLFPPFMGTRLARRIPGTPSARLRKDFDVVLDFAFDSRPSPAPQPYRVTEVLFVAADGDPVDAAVLKVEPVGAAAGTLELQQPDDLDRLYVIGHPGLMAEIPPEVRQVFGNPDERKRVSFGEVMDLAATPANDIVHDASTIGGYSGGCVLAFGAPKVVGLHYWGDTAAGNRAISAAALREHAELSRFLPGG